MDAWDKKINYLFNNTKKFINNINNDENNQHIYIVKSDKGNATTIMYKNKYENEMTNLLNNNENFRICRKDPTSTVQLELTKILEKLVNRNQISVEEKTSLINKYPTAPKIYGLPKIHKAENNNVPLRIITCFVNSPLEKISKKLCQILTKIPPTTNFNIKNSYDCADFIKGKEIPPGYILISLDVIQLFPSVPLKLILKSIENRWQSIKDLTNITITFFLDLITLCYRNNYCEFRGEFYRQIKGLPMGSSLPPIVSDFVMTDLISTVINEKLDFQVPFLLKFVDDILMAIPEDKFEPTLTAFNGYSRNLQFTIEKENNGQIPYLDMIIKRNVNQILTTTFYSKPTATQRVISFKSNHHITQKINTALGLIHRVYSIDTENDKQTKQKIIEEILLKNDYPKTITNTLLKRYENNRNKTQETLPNNVTTYRSIPYIKNLSEKVAKMIKNTNQELTIAFKNKPMNGIFTRLKDQTTQLKKTNVIYSVPCISDGCNKEYIGMTKTSLKKRICGHQSNINTINNNVNKTALCQHIMEMNHIFDLDNAKAIHQNNNYSKLSFLEMLYINDRKNKCVNKKSDYNDLNRDYLGILHLIKKREKQLKQTHTRPV
jgi:hypothetical protein